MRILQHVGSLTGGGAEKVAANLTQALEKNKFQFFTLVTKTSEKDYKHSSEIIVFDSVFRIRLFKFIDKLFKLRRLKRLQKYDITISHNIAGYIYNLLTAKDEKNIFYVHTNLPYTFANKNKFTRAIIRWVLKLVFLKAHHIVAVSEGVKTSLIDTYNVSKNKITTIYNAFDIREIRLKAKTPEIDEKLFNKKNILIIGRLVSLKNHELIINLFENIHKKNKKVNLIILGSGPNKEKLLYLVKVKNLQKNINFVDFDTNPYKYIARSDLVTLASDYEGLSNVLVEAFILKRPILALDTKYGPREILINENRFDDNVNFDSDYGILIKSFYKKVNKEYKIFPISDEIYIKKALLILNGNPFYQKKDLYEKNLTKFAFDHFKLQWTLLLEGLKE